MTATQTLAKIGNDLLDLGLLADRYRELTDQVLADHDKLTRGEVPPGAYLAALVDVRDELAQIEAFAQTLSDTFGVYGTPAEVLERVADDDPVAIRDTYFPVYARELATDMSDVDFTSWPYSCIDWAKAAQLLKRDYAIVEFGPYTYYVTN